MVWTWTNNKDTYIAIDPLQPLLGTVRSLEILQIIDDGDALRLGGAEEVILDGIRAAKGQRLISGFVIWEQHTSFQRRP